MREVFPGCSAYEMRHLMESIDKEIWKSDSSGVLRGFFFFSSICNFFPAEKGLSATVEGF